MVTLRLERQTSPEDFPGERTDRPRVILSLRSTAAGLRFVDGAAGDPDRGPEGADRVPRLGRPLRHRVRAHPRAGRVSPLLGTGRRRALRPRPRGRGRPTRLRSIPARRTWRGSDGPAANDL